MAVFEQWFKQDLLDPIKIHSCGDVVFNGDNFSNIVGVRVFRGGVPVSLTGTVICNVIRADGATVVIGNGSISGEFSNEASVSLVSQALAIPGKLGVMIQLVSGDNKTTLLKVVYFSHQSSTSEIVDPGHIVPDVDDVIAKFAEMEDAIDACEAAASEVTDIILVQDTQPVEETNKIWLPETIGEGVQVPTLDEFDDLKSAIDASNVEIFGGVGEGFPLKFENGTYYSNTAGQALQKYYGGGYDLTRKVVKTTTFTPPCIVRIKAKTGYSFTVFLSANGIISSNTGLITEYMMKPGQQYGMTLRTTGGSDDISAVPVTSIIDIEYDSIVDDLKSALTIDEVRITSIENSIGEEKTEKIGQYQTGHYWNSQTSVATDATATGYTAYSAIAVTTGKKYELKVRGGTSSKQDPLLFVDGENNIISKHGARSAVDQSITVYAPVGAVYALITAGTANTTVLANTSFKEVVVSDISDLPGELEKTQNDVADIIEGIGFKNVSVVGSKSNNKYWNCESTTAVLTSYNGYSAYDAIEVVPGRIYYASIYQQTSTKQKPLLFVTENLTIIEGYSGTSSQVNNFVATAPSNAKYALITTRPASPAIMYYKEMNHPAPEWDLLKGKRVAIIGDSISTNGNPSSGEYPNAVEITVTAEDVGAELSAYLTYFDVQAGLSLGGHTFTSEEIGTEVTFTPVSDDIGKVIGLPNNYNPNTTTVWWEVAKNELGFTPIPVCWSGASVTSHEGTDSNLKTSYAWHDAQIRKCGIRIPGTMTRVSPDVIILYRGTNDFSHSPVTRLTDNYPGGISWVYPETDVVQTDKFGYKEGLCLLVKKLRQAYPNATIYFCTLNVFKRMNHANFPTRNSYNTLPEYNEAIRETARFLGIDIIDFANDGITFENCYSGGYITDDADTPTHPSDKGHAVMGKKAIADLKASYSPL